MALQLCEIELYLLSFSYSPFVVEALGTDID